MVGKEEGPRGSSPGSITPYVGGYALSPTTTHPLVTTSWFLVTEWLSALRTNRVRDRADVGDRVS
jgi:hypothetical protein